MKELFFVGGYSNEIGIYEFEQGQLKLKERIYNVPNPSYLNINNNVLYAISETDYGGIYTYNISKNGIRKINIKNINQAQPCYVSSNKDRNRLLVANYSGRLNIYV